MNKCVTNKCLLGLQNQWDSERNFNKRTLLGSLQSATQSLQHTVSIYDDSSFPRTVLTKFFQAVIGKYKGSS